MARLAHPLFRLIYHSRQAPTVVADLDFNVRAIIHAAIRNNREFRLTGVLVTIQSHFLQALEGPEAAVRGAYNRIALDPRHSDIAIISSGLAETRLFGEWNMCARALAPTDKAILDVLDRKGVFNPAKLTPQSAATLLRTVADIQRRTALSALIS